MAFDIGLNDRTRQFLETQKVVISKAFQPHNPYHYSYGHSYVQTGNNLSLSRAWTDLVLGKTVLAVYWYFRIRLLVLVWFFEGLRVAKIHLLLANNRHKEMKWRNKAYLPVFQSYKTGYVFQNCQTRYFDHIPLDVLGQTHSVGLLRYYFRSYYYWIPCSGFKSQI